MNYSPKIYVQGSPQVNNILTFSDENGFIAISNYGSLSSSADWNFGDGYTSSTTNLASSFEHSYTSIGTYTVSISAYFDIDKYGSFQYGLGEYKGEGIVILSASTSINILSGGNCKAKENYIKICGPDMLGRFGSCRNINLVEYLPLYLRGGETEKFLVLFEDFLNEMYPGLCGWQLSGIDLPVTERYVLENPGVSAEAVISSTYDISGSITTTESVDAEEVQLHWPTNASYDVSAQRISILEKIYRLTELHDPDLIDLQYIQFFAKNLGYNINVSREEIGNSGTTEQFGTTEFQNECSASEINRYLRFVVSNLPTWYKIKTTKNAVKVMLYSFGLVGDIVEYFTNNYKSINNGGSWRLNYDTSMDTIPNNWFPTPHFAIWIDIESSSDLSKDIQRKNKVLRAIESLRPVNTVFDKLYGYIRRDIKLTCAGFVRFSRQIRLKSEGYSNGWAGW